MCILPVFFWVLERIICNCLYEYFMNNNFLLENQFGFQINNLVEHAQNFDNCKLTLGGLIGLSKAFEAVGH